MFELGTRNEQKWFIQLLNNTRWYDVWKTMNEVKPIHLIPGLNMMTVYQLSEYFEVPIRLIRNIENKHHLGDQITRKYIQGDEFSFLALNKKKVMFEGVQHWQYDFRDFSIHMASAGAICYSPQLVEEFLPYIRGSKICSDIIRKLIKGFDFDCYSYLGINLLNKKLLDFEKNEAKIAYEKAREAETKRIVDSVLADIKIEQLPISVEVMVRI